VLSGLQVDTSTFLVSLPMFELFLLISFHCWT
jgi:hypothetical protein